MSAPILRSPDTDDDGSGTTGTIRDNAWKTAIYDAIDESNADVLSSTATGTQNNFALGASGDVVLRWNGASAVVFSGFTNGAAGRSFILENVTAAQTVRVSHEDTGSTAGNRAICESTNGQILGAGGRGLAVYDSTSSRWRFTVIDPGAPITRTFAAGNYTASGSMTWTVASGDVTNDSYIQRGKKVQFSFWLNTTTVGGTPSTDLMITIPGGFTAVSGKDTANPCRIVDSGTGAIGYAIVLSAGTTVIIRASPAATAPNWTASTDNTFIQGQIEIEVA